MFCWLCVRCVLACKRGLHSMPLVTCSSVMHDVWCVCVCVVCVVVVVVMGGGDWAFKTLTSQKNHSFYFMKIIILICF